MVSGFGSNSDFTLSEKCSQREKESLLPLEHGDAAQSEKEHVQHQRHANETRHENRNERAGHGG